MRLNAPGDEPAPLGDEPGDAPGLSHQQYTKAIMILCAKYGRLMVWGDGGSMSWQKLIDGENPLFPTQFLKSVSQALVWGPKTNVLPDWFDTTSRTQGLWLTNMSTSLLWWHEQWFWTSAGFGTLGQKSGINTGVFNDQ